MKIKSECSESKSNVVDGKFGKKVAFHCECCNEPVAVDELETDHVLQVLLRLLDGQDNISIRDVNPEYGAIKLGFFGREFDVMVFDPFEEADDELAQH